LHRSSSALQYLKKRALRILPALLVCNLFCIIFLGLFFGSLPWLKYLQQPDTWTYLWYNTTLYKNQFHLPGVFDKLKPGNVVNASLWTLTVEVGLYISLLILFLSGLFKTKLGIAITGLIFILIAYFLHDKTFHGWRLEYYVNLSLFFFQGSMLYLFRDSFNPKLYWLLPFLLLFFLLEHQWIKWLLVTGIASYLVILGGKSKQVISLKGNDVSYGLYIYAFPIQQIILLLVGEAINPWLHVVLTVLFAFPFAFLSWRFVEKPALRLKGAA
jgi:peptidoglycan/LPS O-acetylase OafA/YrhL